MYHCCFNQLVTYVYYMESACLCSDIFIRIVISSFWWIFGYVWVRVKG